jgi:hypothetical protein
MLKGDAHAPDTQAVEPSDASSRPNLKLGLLLTCLLATFLAMLDIRSEWFGLGEGQAQSGRLQFSAGCPGREAPEVTSIPIRDLAQLHGQLSRIMPERVGRVYERGPISTANLWTDNEPPGSPPHGTSAPAAFEVRWWALNRDGDEDDVVADVLEFATEREAEDTLALAGSARCRRNGAARAARLPAGGREIVWRNPDNAWQRDVMFVRGRRLYRVSDVPPGLLAATGPRRSSREWRMAGTTAQALACALPDALCPASAASLRGSSLAPLTGGEGAGTSRPPTAAAASAYARAVNMRGYDVPGMSVVAPEGPASEIGLWSACAGNTGEPRPTRAVATVRSPEFAYRSRGEDEFVHSTVVVLASSTLAGRYLEALDSERVRACIARDYRRRLEHPRLGGKRHVEALTLTRLPNATPRSYRGSARYRAVALRLDAKLRYATRAGRRGRLALYIQDYTFAYGRALVELTSFTFAHPFPTADEQFLEAQLVGSAQADEALL